MKTQSVKSAASGSTKKSREIIQYEQAMRRFDKDMDTLIKLRASEDVRAFLNLSCPEKPVNPEDKERAERKSKMFDSYEDIQATVSFLKEQARLIMCASENKIESLNLGWTMQEFEDRLAKIEKRADLWYNLQFRPELKLAEGTSRENVFSSVSPAKINATDGE